MSEIKKVSGDAGVVGVVVGDFLRGGLGMRSRLGEEWRGGVTVLGEVVGRLLRVGEGRGECRLERVVVLLPEGQVERGTQELRSLGLEGEGGRVRVRGLVEREAGMSARVRVGRAWGMYGWRGGAGQWTVFDEEYHPRGIAEAVGEAAHVLVVHSHGVMLDVGLTEALIWHHLHKNHEMRVTYTPCAPGLTGMVLQGGIVREMGEKGVMPGQLLGYDPGSPTGDTLIRDACMQVDPGLSKVQNRFCVDTERGWGLCKELCGGSFSSLAEMAGAGARMVGPGGWGVKAWEFPREVEIELTGRRETSGAGSVPGVVRLGRGEMEVGRWVDWISSQKLAEDLLVTVGGDGDPLLYLGLVEVLRALRAAGVLSVCVQTDLVSGVEGLVEAIGEGLVDVVSVTMWGATAGTYEKVGGVDGFGRVMGNLERVGAAAKVHGGLPLVVPRLVKVRETIGEMEGFFDEAVRRFGWGVFDGPTDRAGQVEGRAVVSMAPPGRRACRRLWDRLVVRANGVGVACDQDMMDTLSVGTIATHGVVEMWRELEGLRERHRRLEIGGLVCERCSEWHRA